MFSALFRRSHPASRAATRYTPRLEALDGDLIGAAAAAAASYT